MGVALSGYIFLSNSYIYKFKIPHYQGHHLFYRALFTGLIIYSASFAVFCLSWPMTKNSSKLFELFDMAFPGINQLSFNMLAMGLSSLLLAWAGALLHNAWNRLKMGRSVQLQCYMEATDSELISHVLALSYIEPRALLISLSNRKCYVCYPYELKTPKIVADHQEISIIPIMTGYRDDKDLCLELTTRYEEVIDILKKESNEIERMSKDEYRNMEKAVELYRIAIPYKEIVSMAYFDLEKYKSFKEKENVRRRKIKKARELKGLSRWKRSNWL